MVQQQSLYTALVKLSELFWSHCASEKPQILLLAQCSVHEL